MKISIVLFDKEYSDGQKPVMLRFSFLNKSKYKTLFKIDPKYWDPQKKCVIPGHIFEKKYNTLIKKEHAEAEARLINLQITGGEITHDKVLGKTVYSEGNKPEEYPTVTKMAALYMEKKRSVLAGGTLRAYESKIKDIVAAVGDVRSNEMKKDTSLAIVQHEQEKGNGAAVIKRKITLLNQILKWNNIEVQLNNYLKIQKTKKPQLSTGDIGTLEAIDLEGDYSLVRDVLLMQYFCKGARVSDMIMLKKSAVSESRVEFRQRKTGKLISIPRFVRLDAILEKYMTGEGEYFFPLIEKYMREVHPKISDPVEKKKDLSKEIDKVNSRIRKCIIVISKSHFSGRKIRPHMIRHTFTRHAQAAGVQMRDIQGFLGHSNLETTEIYAAELQHDAGDDSLLSVYGGDHADKAKKEELRKLLKSMSAAEILELLKG